MATISTRHIPEYPIAGKPLGRHVRHDSRSLDYLVPEADPSTLTSVRHERHIPVLDQGDLGSCTGNAALGAVGTGSLYLALNDSPVQPWATDEGHDEQLAVQLYSAATKLDDAAGSYPPDDTGSSGLAVAKAAQRAGLISGYRHATSLAAALTALAAGPVITGVNWYDSFDEPVLGGISITPGAQVRGGHEFVVDELDVEHRTVGFTNSWGKGWGLDGRAYMSWDTWARLLSEEGDVTVFVPVTAPAPTPAPFPGPVVTADQTLAAAAAPWLSHHHTGTNRRMAEALSAWLEAKGL